MVLRPPPPIPSRGVGAVDYRTVCLHHFGGLDPKVRRRDVATDQKALEIP